MTTDKLEEIQFKDKLFKKRISMFVNALLRRSEKIPLDYILPTQSSLDENC